MPIVDNFINTALDEVGTIEKNDLNNKYRKWCNENILEVVCGHINSSWANSFIVYCAAKSKLTKDIIPFTTYLPNTILWFINKKRYHSIKKPYVPKKGDLIFFKNITGNPCHIGIVYEFKNNTIYTIEGNSNNSEGLSYNGGVCVKKKYSILNKRILGFGSPLYNNDKGLEELSDNEIKEIINETCKELVSQEVETIIHNPNLSTVENFSEAIMKLINDITNKFD